MKKSKLFFATAFLMLLAVSSCKKEDTKTETPQTPATLYIRVGGTTMVADPNNPGQMIEGGRLTLRAVVDSSILIIAADPQMAKFFPVLFSELGTGNTSGLTALSKNFTDFMCSATGATNTKYMYMGLNMKDAHDPAKHNRMGTKVSSEDFDRFVGHIGAGLAENGVNSTNNKQLVDDLVALLYTTKADIVQK